MHSPYFMIMLTIMYTRQTQQCNKIYDTIFFLVSLFCSCIGFGYQVCATKIITVCTIEAFTFCLSEFYQKECLIGWSKNPYKILNSSPKKNFDIPSQNNVRLWLIFDFKCFEFKNNSTNAQFLEAMKDELKFLWDRVKVLCYLQTFHVHIQSISNR